MVNAPTMEEAFIGLIKKHDQEAGITPMRILKAFIIKEFYQIVRDPSSILIAFVLPLMIIFLYRYGVNLDTVKVRIGMKIDDPSQQITTLVDSFRDNRFIDLVIYDNPQKCTTI